MIVQAIERVQEIERQVRGKTSADLNVRIAIRACLKELRSIGADDVSDIVSVEDHVQSNVIAFSARAASR